MRGGNIYWAYLVYARTLCQEMSRMILTSGNEPPRRREADDTAICWESSALECAAMSLLEAKKSVNERNVFIVIEYVASQ